MIITREVKIKVNEANYQYLDNLGYDVVLADYILLPIELLSKGSHHKIECKCDGDNCNVVKKIIFKNYIKYNNVWGYYYCRKCSENKRKISLRKNFNCDYPIQNREIFERKQNTINKNKTK